MKKHVYRKFSLSMAMLLTTCLSFGSAFAAPAEDQPRNPWYEITEDIIIVRLPADNAAGCEWDYELSNPDMLELLSIEYIDKNQTEEKERPENAEETPDFADKAFPEALPEGEIPEDLPMNRPGEIYTASFQLTEGQTGDCTLTLSYSGENEGEEPLRTCVLHLSVDSEGEISVVSAEETGIEPPAGEAPEAVVNEENPYAEA